jgi:hypothetical protein
LTHYSPKDEEKAFDFPSLFDLTQKLGFLLEAAIIENAIDVRRWGRLVQFTADD